VYVLDGKRKRKKKRGFKTKVEAMKALGTEENATKISVLAIFYTI
jgi:hypothetical protein